jgi:hypothetical protein
MTNDIETTKEEHTHSAEMKLKHLGYGEWVEEPDLIEFEYKDFECKVLRILHREPYSKEECYFGGYLCGYVKIPENHPSFNKQYNDIEVDCHGGLTYSEKEENAYWIGFDCAHLMDYVPSMELFRKTNKDLLEFRKKFPIPQEYKSHPLFKPTYKNVNFCMEECKSIVNQLIEIPDLPNE